MRTTLAIDDDVLVAAKRLARERHQTIGQVISELARKSLMAVAPATRNGIPILTISNPDAVVTLEIVNALRDELP